MFSNRESVLLWGQVCTCKPASLLDAQEGGDWWEKSSLVQALLANGSSLCLRTLRLRKVVPNLTGKAERMGSEMFYSLRHLDDLIARIDDGVVTVGMMVMVM